MRRELVERARSGDHDAFAQLAATALGRSYNIARLILRDHELAQDAVQEAFVSAWRDLSSLRDPDRFEAWLTRLVVRSCYREARRRQRFGRFELDIGSIEPGKRADVALFGVDDLEHAGAGADPVAAVVHCLPGRVRRLFVEGREVVVDARLANVDERAVAEKAHDLARRIASR